MRTRKVEKSDILLQKTPCDMGIHRTDRKGTLKAPETILDNIDFRKKVLIDEVFPDEFDLEETQSRINENTKELAEYDKPIVSIGGDHSVSYPIIQALKNEYPDLKLIWLDSHLDLKQRVDGHVSHDVVVRQLLEEEFEKDEVVFVGCTRVDDDEKEFLDKNDLRVFKSSELEEFLREFNWKEHPVYLSVDIDVLKSDLAPGTGYPDGELELDEVIKVVEEVKPSHADLVEVAPTLDKNKKTIRSAKKILKEIVRSAKNHSN